MDTWPEPANQNLPWDFGGWDHKLTVEVTLEMHVTVGAAVRSYSTSEWSPLPSFLCQRKEGRTLMICHLDLGMQLYLKQDIPMDFSFVQVSKSLFFHSTNNIWVLSKCPVVYWTLGKQHGRKYTWLSSLGTYRLIERAFPLAMNLTGVCQLNLCKKCEEHNRWCLQVQFYEKCRDNLHVHILSIDPQQKPGAQR